MGLFSGGNSKNTTNAYDQSATTTNNTSLAGGDSDVSDSIVATHSNLSTVDNSLALSLSDNSYKDSSVRTSSTDNRDSSNNSFNLDMSGSDYSQRTSSTTDNSDSSNNSFNLDMSGSDYSQRSDSTTNITTTDGGSFSMVSNIMGKMIDSFSGTQNKLADLVGVSQKATMSATNDFVSRSMDAQKESSTVAEIIGAENSKIKLFAGAAIAAAGLFAVYKMARGK